MSPPISIEHTQRGTAADRLLLEKDYATAQAQYYGLLGDIQESKTVDSFLVGKAVLGLLLTKIGQKDSLGAGEIWQSSMNDGTIIGIGINSLEQGQCNTRDAIIYLMASANLYSWCETTDISATQRTIDSMMVDVLGFAVKKHRSWIPKILSNWRIHLSNLHGDKELTPQDMFVWQKSKNQVFEGLVPATPVWFPSPSEWKPLWENS